jgi:Zn-dependent protease
VFGWERAVLPQPTATEVAIFKYRLRLCTLFGFEVWIDASWLLLAALLIWTFGAGVFPDAAPNLAKQTYWWMAIVATIGFFVSIVLHELSHSLVARRYGMPIRGITLFIFGGVADLEGEPRSAHVEFLMAAAGPLASFILGAALALVVSLYAYPTTAVPTVLGYLALLNTSLALFNLVPAFPLDGGRILRAGLWAWRGDFAWATRIAAACGDVFGILLIVGGAFDVIRGDFVTGMWQFLIGLFLRNAAAASYQESMVRRVLTGTAVQRLMTPDPITVPPEISVADFIEDYIYRFHHRSFPVVRDGRLIGIVGTKEAVGLDRQFWASTPVERILVPCEAEDLIAPAADTAEALAQLRRRAKPRLYVVSDGHLAGVLSLRDLLDVLALKLEVEAGRDRPGPVRTPERQG